MKIIKEPTKTEIKKLQKMLQGDLTSEQKDELISYLTLSLFETKKSLKILHKAFEEVSKETGAKTTLTKSQTETIEESVSVGPSWLNFTRKVRTKRK